MGKLSVEVVPFNVYLQNSIVETVTLKTVKIYACQSFFNQRKISIIII